MFGYSSEPLESNIWCFFDFNIYTGIYNKANSSLTQKSIVILDVLLCVCMQTQLTCCVRACFPGLCVRYHYPVAGMSEPKYFCSTLFYIDL